jgi:1,4-alpha-glucan branching enzyme
MTAKYTFELLAPYNEEVTLIGSWNQWQPIPMQKGDDGVWRTAVTLADGDYEYKFQVKSLSWFAAGKTVTVADPKAMRYTFDNRENAILTLKNGVRCDITYQWKHDDVPLPTNDQLIIYEMHIGDFRGGAGDTDDKRGTFTRMIEKLDYLVELGINAIELMPINEFPGHHSWGYSQRSIYAVENSYGTPNELCQLVDECHARGIRVIHDAVYNHMEADAPLTQIDYEYWFYRDNPDEPALQFGPKFNYEKHDEHLQTFPARAHVMGAMDSWVQRFRFDGIRFDCTRAIKYFDLLKWFHDTMHARIDFKPFYTIAEHIPQDAAITGIDGPMDAAWHDNFYRQLIATTLGVPHDGREPFNTTALLQAMDWRYDKFATCHNTIHYLNNHDQERVIHLLGEAAKTFGDAAFRRCKLGASLLLTAPGVPMLWMGEEFGQPTPKSMDSQPLQWGLLESAPNRGLFNHYKFLIGLRKGCPALYSDNFEVVLNLPERGVVAYKRWDQAGNVIVVVANLKDEFAGEFEIAGAGLTDGRWHEAVYNFDLDVTGGHLKDTLAESDVKIYVLQPAA